MNRIIESIILNTKKAYKESIVIDNEKLQDLLLTILTDSKKLEELKENEMATNTNINSKEKTSTRYTYDQVKAITKIQVQLAHEKMSLSVAENEVTKIASSFPIQHLKQYNTRVISYLNGIGQHGFAFPSNWAKALLEETNNDPLVVKAFRQQQELYLEKENRINQKLENILNSIG
jgi:3D (Asp-Asp-Asp) domain-containing protein